jgi:nitrogen-specific signal transduction histidine kinase/ActR/RegA family two-component response regulator
MGGAAVVRDVTEKVLFENQMRQTQKMEAIGTLAGGIAHDFNNMLGVIIGCSELAMDGVPEDSKAAADMERVLDAGLRAKALVRQILTFSRQSESELKPLILRPFLKEVVKFLRTTLPASVNISLTRGSDDYTILADPTQLQQIMLNLCTNSAHALEPDGGSIEVSLSEWVVTSHETGPAANLDPGLYVKLTVRDDGPGIPPDCIHRVFDPFFTTKNVGEGTGLGLSVVHGIVKNHGGAVYVESEPGRGTTMQVLFPSLEHPGFEPAPESTMIPPEGREEILLVEDEPVLADILDRILTGLGYKVKTFSGGDEAWRFFEGNPDRFDLVLLDHNMPVVTGIELSARINRLRPGLPVILYTGMGIEKLREEAEKAGVRTIMNKPLNRIELAVAVREVLDGSFRRFE